MSRWLTIFTLVLMNAGRLSAQPAALPLEQLDDILKGWEKRMNDAASLHARCRQTVDDKTF
ncbi:MAG: hypothetical protein AB7K24_06040, partial [Gemmataceae bacterium]